MASSKRSRATVVIIRNNTLLLVRDRGRHHYSLPGGGFKHGETTIQAGIREVCHEELGGLTVLSAKRLRVCDFQGERAKHKVCQLEVEGNPYIKSKELDNLVWWDMRSDISIQGHVTYILKQVRKVPVDSQRTDRKDAPLFDAYNSLGVNPDDSIELIKAIYRKKSMYYHPDIGGTNEKMKKLNWAYNLVMESRGQKL